MQLSQSVIIALVTLWQVLDLSCAKYLLDTFKGSVGGGNATYYKLSREGPVRLVLESTYGDTDLYLSDKTLHPDFENYELQSVTCGDDEVIIPLSFKRPVGVAVYGHPTHDVSQYKLSVYVDGGSAPSASYSPSSSPHNTGGSKFAAGSKDEEESILWTIFVGILKIIFDILM